MQCICEKCLHIISMDEPSYCIKNKKNINNEIDNPCECLLCPVKCIQIYNMLSDSSCPICLQHIYMTNTPIVKYKCNHWICLHCHIEVLYHGSLNSIIKCAICSGSIITDYKIFGGTTLCASDFYDTYEFNMNVDLDMSVQKLKRLMSYKIHISDPMLVFGDIVLEDDRSLQEYGIYSCSVIKFLFTFFIFLHIIYKNHKSIFYLKHVVKICQRSTTNFKFFGTSLPS